MMKKDFEITPLHQAIIDDDVEAVMELRQNEELCQTLEPLGFSPLELAQFLGRDKCQLLLGGELATEITLLVKGESETQRISAKMFEELFGIVYRPFLNFGTYKKLKAVVENCPYLLKYPWIASENHLLGQKYKSELACGYVVPVSVRWIDDVLEYGLFAEVDIEAEAFIGEYTGFVRRLYRKSPDQNAYCFHYPSRFWSFNYFVVDALHEGNVLRFINHSETPNLFPACAVERGVLHQIFFAKHDIPKGSQLTFDYGPDYWIRRKKKENV